jgi:hypothetical protein
VNVKTALQRARTFEAWLRALIGAYQDRRLKPRNRSYSNLTRMPRPTQMYAITLGRVAVVIVSHRKEAGNGVALAVRLRSIQELAEFSEIADAYFGTSDLVPEYASFGRLFQPPVGVAQHACIALAELWRSGQRPLVPPRGTFRVETMQALQVLPPAALWSVRYRGPFPEPQSVLLTLGNRLRRRTVGSAASEAAPAAQPMVKAQPVCYAAFTEPLVWFGRPAYPSPRDRILNRLWRPQQAQRPLCRARVGEIETLVYNNGLILAVTGDRRVALRTINQVFGVMSRSGVVSFALPDLELIKVSQLNAESGEIGGYDSAMTPRNRLLGVPALDRPTQLSYFLPEDVVVPLLDLADRCARDHDMAVASLRLLSAVTLHYRQFYTEAFVTGWSLIETAIERDFEAFWLEWGRSRTAVEEMDWTASQKIDFMMAVGGLDRVLGEQIHRLRKRRNAIVHDLTDAAEGETIDCIAVASEMTPLPAFPEVLKAQIVLL